jgi:hypothetical protein
MPRSAATHFNEHVMQAVAKLMEQRLDIVMGQQAGVAFARRRKIAVQEGHRQLPAFLAQPPRTAGVHPGPAPFVRARKQVHVQAGNAFPVFIVKPEKARVFMPDRHALIAFQADAENPSGDVEGTDHHAGVGLGISSDRKVRPPVALPRQLMSRLRGAAGASGKTERLVLLARPARGPALQKSTTSAGWLHMR